MMHIIIMPLPDWIQDSILERNRRLRTTRRVNATNRGPNGEITLAWVWAQMLKAVSAAQTWLVISVAGKETDHAEHLVCIEFVFFTGVCIGINAALISIVTEWLSDIKMGYCYDGWWLNQQFCCWEIEGDENACDSWHPWSTVSLARWLIYVIFAVRSAVDFLLLNCSVYILWQGLFSFISAHLVKSFAKYAAGSGISEIKCILAGFIMKGYLGVWTLAVKSLTLVSTARKRPRLKT